MVGLQKIKEISGTSGSLLLCITWNRTYSGSDGLPLFLRWKCTAAHVILVMEQQRSRRIRSRCYYFTPVAHVHPYGLVSSVIHHSESVIISGAEAPRESKRHEWRRTASFGNSGGIAWPSVAANGWRMGIAMVQGHITWIGSLIIWM